MSALPWYKSRVIVGAVVSILTKLLVLTGLVGEIAPEDEQRLIDAALLLIGGTGDLVAIIARVRQERAPPIRAKRKRKVKPRS